MKAPDYTKIDFISKRMLSLAKDLSKEIRDMDEDEKKFIDSTLKMLEKVTKNIKGSTNLACLLLGVAIIEGQAMSIQEMLKERARKQGTIQ